MTEFSELVGGVSDTVVCVNATFPMLTYQPIAFLHTHGVTFSYYLAVTDVFLAMSFRKGWCSGLTILWNAKRGGRGYSF